jgi:lysophospholipase L1-like esterase
VERFDGGARTPYDDVLVFHDSARGFPASRRVPRASIAALFLILSVGPLEGLVVPALAQPATTWYLAEGATGPAFVEEINIGNPNATAANVTITLLLPSGGPIVHTLTVPATARATVRVNDIPGAANTAVSAVVESTNAQDIVVDRAMRYPIATERNSHTANAVRAPALTWYLAEGATGFFEQFVLIQNPNATDAQVTVTYLRSAGAPVVQNYTVLANSRFTIWVNQMVPGLAAAEFSTVVQSTNSVPVIAERAMYFGNFSGGMDEVGVTAPAESWTFAEGFTGTGFGGGLAFDTFLLLANPSGTDAQVQVTYFREAPAAPVVKTYTVLANSRQTVWVDQIPGLENASFGIQATSQNSVAFLAERAEYWGPPGTWMDGSAVAGATAEADKWAFAGGRTGGFTGRFYDTFYLVSNASVNPLALRATFYREDGTGVVKTFTVPAQSRFTISANAYVELSNQRFAAVLESTNGVTFVAERATYSASAPGSAWEGGDASFGVPWAGTAAPPPPAAPPTLTGISPNAGPANGGTAITVTGTNFAQGAQVYLGGAQATGVFVNNATTITATTAPRTAGTVDLAVISGGQTVILAGAFTYQATVPPPATLTGISPNTGSTAGGTAITLTGTNFVQGAQVSLGGTAATNVVVQSATTITAVTAAHVGGAVDVVVVNAGQTLTLPGAFTYKSPFPFTFTDISLAFGDSITAGITADQLSLGTISLPVRIQTTSYPEYLHGLLQARYTTQTITVHNAGLSGEWAEDGKVRLPQVLTATSPHDLLILLEGINDLNALGPGSAPYVRDQLLYMVRYAKSTLGRKVILCTLTPIYPNINGNWPGDPASIAALNARLPGVAQAEGAILVDLFAAFGTNRALISSDGLHPSPAGYQFMAQVIYNAIVANFESP